MPEEKAQFDILWINRGGPPRIVADPTFPDGVDIDASRDGEPACTVALPYPTGKTNIGGWKVTCRRCGVQAFITAASRPDDPRSLKLPCLEGQA